MMRYFEFLSPESMCTGSGLYSMQINSAFRLIQVLLFPQSNAPRAQNRAQNRRLSLFLKPEIYIQYDVCN